LHVCSAVLLLLKAAAVLHGCCVSPVGLCSNLQAQPSEGLQCGSLLLLVLACSCRVHGLMVMYLLVLLLLLVLLCSGNQHAMG
jgi:hypothetical protein